VVKHLSFEPIHLILHMINRTLKERLDPRDLAYVGKPLGQDFLKVFSLIELF
jgi:hypothetical protein